ncbi:MAG: tetratricopeptide repeat protein [Candidatus Parcubacteria bacterium]|nr:tetratricopeptide repeat protein [Candidatus Parcubacteria bacterium]
MSEKTEALLSKAQNFNRKGKHQEAINAYNQALVLDSKDIRISLQLAELYLKINDETKAIHFFLSGASLLEHDGFLSRAVAVLKRILDFSPNNVEVLKSLHDLYPKLGLLVEAAEYEEKLKALGVEIEQPAPAKMATKKKRQSRKRLKRLKVGFTKSLS